MSNPERAIQAAKLYAAGLSTREIAEKLLIGRSTVSLDLRSVGVTMDGAARISSKAKGRPSHRLGAKHTAETRAQMSLSRAGKMPTLGTRRTDAQKARMSISQQGSRKTHANTISTYVAAVGCVFHGSRPVLMSAGVEMPSVRLIRMAEQLFLRPISDAKIVVSRKIILSPEERNARQKARNSYKQMLRRILTMARVRKDLPSERLLGYTQKELRARIEGQFSPEMSWANRGSFHIDHIVPVAHFFRRGITDPAVINALANLQPLTPSDNRKKGDRMPVTGIQSV